MRVLLLPTALAALASALAGCKAEVTCGDGTVLSNARCVPEKLVACGPGTKEEGRQCVPVATITCGAGTLERDGRCVPRSELTCGPGTEELGGVCVVLDPMRRVTVPEGAEPNAPPGLPTQFQLPEIGEDPVVLGGNVGPVVGGAADLDVFMFSAAAGTRLSLKATAVGAATVGLLVQPIDDTLSFARVAVSIESRGASREVVLPVAGDWLLIASDQNNLVGGVPIGGADFTYTIDIEHLAPKEPTVLVPPGPVTGDVTELQPHALDVTDDAPVYDLSLDEPADPGFPGVRALWATGPDGKLLVNQQDEIFYEYVFPMEPVRLALPAGRTLVYVDYMYALGADLPPYALRATKAAVEDLKGLDAPFDQRASLSGTGNDLYAIDVREGTLLSIEANPWSTSSINPLIELRNRRWELIQAVRGKKLAQYFQPGEGGRYFVSVTDLAFYAGKAPLDYGMKARVDPVTAIGPVSIGGRPRVEGTFTSGPSTYAVYAGNDAAFTVTLTPASSANAVLQVFPANLRQPIGESDLGAAGIAESVTGVVAPAGGLFLAQVSGDEGATFSLGIDAGDTTVQFEAEPDDVIAKAMKLTLDADGKAQVAGRLTGSADQDWYAFELAAPATVVVETRAGITGAKTDTRIALLNASSASLASGDDWNGGRFSRAQASLQAGTWYVRVQRGYNPTAPWDGDDYLLLLNP